MRKPPRDPGNCEEQMLVFLSPFSFTLKHLLMTFGFFVAILVFFAVVDLTRY